MARTDDAPMSLRELVESPNEHSMRVMITADNLWEVIGAVEADEHEEIAPGKIFASSSLHI
jgi:hypothetical protein